MTVRDETTTRIAGLYGIADAATSHGDPVGLGADLLDGGCRLVQLRCKDWAPDDVVAAARALGARCRSVGATFIVNDAPDVAAASDADGVHIGQTDGDVADARRVLGPDRIIGRSTGDLDAVRAALVDADYLAFGPIFDTPNLSRFKAVRGIERLTAVRVVVPRSVPLVAIGGITAERLPAIREAGASAWAVIGAVADAPDRGAAIRSLL
jgi:thiamine-phosphate diphosphorylase